MTVSSPETVFASLVQQAAQHVARRRNKILFFISFCILVLPYKGVRPLILPGCTCLRTVSNGCPTQWALTKYGRVRDCRNSAIRRKIFFHEIHVISFGGKNRKAAAKTGNRPRHSLALSRLYTFPRSHTAGRSRDGSWRSCLPDRGGRCSRFFP